MHQEGVRLLIGERTAEQIKMEIGSAFPLDEKMTMEIRGRHLIEGVPKTITISFDEEIREALPRPSTSSSTQSEWRSSAPRLVGGHRRSRHRADRRRIAPQESRQAAARRAGVATGDG